VDNHCKDGVHELLKKDFPFVKVILREDNVGFGKGCNIGFAAYDAEYTLFLNPDAEINIDNIKVLSHFLDTHNKVAAVAPSIHYEEGLQSAGDMPTLYPKTDYKFTSQPILPNQAPFETNWLCGAILMVRSTYFVEVGRFDERFFLYYEETDLCKRFTDSNYELWACGNATSQHIGGASSKGFDTLYVHSCIAEHYYKSRYYYVKKHHGIIKAIFNECADFLIISLKFIKGALKSDAVAINRLYTRLRSPFFKLP
jgi:N-acetylglucosaminyl-diphospho-decaprenol L-rhamnosyltransferase